MKILNYRDLIGIYQLSPQQRLLLQASILKGQVALKAWQEWKAIADIEVLDASSNALLSQLYQNLAANQVEDCHMARLKGIYKQNWYHNQLLFQKVKAILQFLQEAQIPVIIFGNLAIALAYCNDLAQLNVNSLNFLIHPSDAQQAIAILAELGWNQVNSANSIINEQDLRLEFQDKSNTYLCLQNHLFWAIPQEYTDEQLWHNALPYSMGDVSTLILSPTDLFLHLSIKTFDRQQNSTVHLLLNAIILLAHHESKIDWIRLVAQAQKYQAILPLRSMVIILQQLFEPSIPDWILPALNQMPISRQEFIKYQTLPLNKKEALKIILLRLTFRLSNIIK